MRELVIDCVLKNGLHKFSILDCDEITVGPSSALDIRSLPNDSEAMRLND